MSKCRGKDRAGFSVHETVALQKWVIAVFHVDDPIPFFLFYITISDMLLSLKLS